MSLRETLNKKPGVSAMAAGALVIIGVILSVVELRGRGQPRLPVIPERCFYTTDDGATLFVESLGKIPPFDHGGQQAVRAYAFSCDGGKHRWVGYLEKYDEKAKPGAPAHEGATDLPPRSALLVKRPGAVEWVSAMDAAAARVTNPQCPDGMGSGPVTVVMPE
jgi:hypothetical protein